MCPPHSLAQGSAKEQRNDKLCQITGNERDNASKKGGAETDVILKSKPHAAEKIAYGGPENHAAEAHIPSVKPFINEKAGDKRHKNKTDEVSACRTEELAGTAGKIGKHGKSYKPEQQVNQIAQGSLFHAEHKDGKTECKVGEGKRNGCKGQCDGNRPQDAGYCCHKPDKSHRFDMIFFCQIHFDTVPFL